MSVKVTGLREALHQLEVVLPAEARRLNQEVAMDMAKAIVEEAKPLMPAQTGRMRRGTQAKREKASGNKASATVRVKDAFYWRFLENGDGPDGVEHAMFLRAREKVMASGTHFKSFTKRLTAALRKWR